MLPCLPNGNQEWGAAGLLTEEQELKLARPSSEDQTGLMATLGSGGSMALGSRGSVALGSRDSGALDSNGPGVLGSGDSEVLCGREP